MASEKRVIGVTGGVGSGKSTVLNFLREEFGAEILEADRTARELMEPGGACYDAVVSAFGRGILEDGAGAGGIPEKNGREEGPGGIPEKEAREEGVGVIPGKNGREEGPGDSHRKTGAPIDRKKLAAIVFSDRASREKLNSLTHPLVKQEVQRRIRKSRAPVVVYESAIPREACMRQLCDEIWFIHVPPEVRVERLMASRGYSREKCLAVMASQMSDREFLAIADRVIENGGAPEETEKQLKSIFASAMLLNKSARGAEKKRESVRQ